VIRNERQREYNEVVAFSFISSHKSTCSFARLRANLYCYLRLLASRSAPRVKPNPVCFSLLM